ncbi:hypothetical protein DACRYDRAFT_112677 [Dacryopinax primogenitus]|uniref:Uncharacterized protein n=1 Tax=Dacryopinax primogenitus (strain DJM 731) TaxID=1858805 RepID=M5FTF9_DACPD|nr:uncharacterized protein DACRYDRAFT_112677 [Dacryopinax primogenitus]EJT96531.1 hypothetical protein DACRYDRAFT_112677 [Dacryopinax primogenitus]
MSSRKDKAQQFLSNMHNMLLRAQRDAEIQGSHHQDESNALTDEISCLKEDTSHYRIECNEHCSENDQLKGKLSAFNSTPHPPPPHPPLPSAACKAAPPPASHKADGLYDVLMNISPIEEAPAAIPMTSAVAKVSTVMRVPPVTKASAVALGKHPAVDKLPSVHLQKMQSLVTATSSSHISAVGKTYSAVVASSSGKSSSQKDETVYTLPPQFAPMGIAFTGSKCLPHGLPPYDKENLWEYILTPRHLGAIHEHDPPCWARCLETADTYWAVQPHYGSLFGLLWSKFNKMLGQIGTEINPHANKGAGVCCSWDGHFYIPNLCLWKFLKDHCPHNDNKLFICGDVSTFYKVCTDLFSSEDCFKDLAHAAKIPELPMPHWSTSACFQHALHIVNGQCTWDIITVTHEFAASRLQGGKLATWVSYFGHRARKVQHVGGSFCKHILDKDAAKALLAFDTQNNSLWMQVYQSAIVPPSQVDLPPLGLKPEGFLWSNECTSAIAGPLHVDIPSEKDVSLDYSSDNCDGYNKGL